MTPILIVVALVLVVILVWWVLRPGIPERRGDSRPADGVDTVIGWSPQATRVMTPVECKAFETLRSALPAHMILAQVPLARFVKVPTRNSYAEWMRRVGHLCVDLIVCDRHAQVIAVVELRRKDDQQVSQRARRRQQRLERVLKGAGIPVHMWIEEALPTAAVAREAILPSPPAPPPTPDNTATVTAAVLSSAPGRPLTSGMNPFDEEARDSTSDEVIEMREPPPSTWFDDMDTGATPLASDKAKVPGDGDANPTARSRTPER